MSFADVARGVQGAVQQQLFRRLQEQQLAAQAQEAQRRAAMETRTADRADRGLDLQQQTLNANLKRQTGLDEIAASERAFTHGSAYNEAVPPGTSVDADSLTAQSMIQGGFGSSLTPTAFTLPSTQMAGGAALPGEAPGATGVMSTTDVAAKPRMYIKTRSQKQVDTDADNARAAQTERDRQTDRTEDNARQAAQDLATAEYRRASLARPTGATRERFTAQPITNADGTTGLVRLNMDTGEATPVNLAGAGAGKASDTQRLSAAYLQRTSAAHQNVSPFEAKLESLGSQAGVQLPNLMQTEAGQLYSQGRDEFINAALRRESGAAIQPSEYARFDKIYFVQPGDTKAVIKQKQTARARVVEGFQTASGNIRSGDGATGGGGGEEYDFVNGKLVLRK